MFNQKINTQSKSEYINVDNLTPNNEKTDNYDNEELKSITEAILEIIKLNIQPNKYNTFFENVFTASSLNSTKVTFTVTTGFIKKMIENFYLDTLKAAVAELLGNDFEIEILDMTRKSNDSSKSSVKTVGELKFKVDYNQDHISQSETTVTKINNNKFDSTKRFENFIVGPSNNMAHAFSIAVSKEPGTVYPQLYIHGNSGLGKTHLLHSVCNYIKEHKPHLRVCFTTTTDFMSEMVMAIQGTKSGSDKVAEFRRKYTELVDILIIDDIHELQGKTRTQAEFFYVFNQLTAKKKQLIFTSDKAPKEIIGLEDRVMTRLNSALIVDIQHPDLETRIAILKKKALEKDIYLDDQIINLIANSVKSSVRELEGKLVKLGAYSDLMNVDIDLEIAKQQLNLETIGNERLINADSITKSVANYFSLPIGDIKGKTRKKEITLARHIAMYMIHKFAKITLEDIGKFFDGRDHSTVIHGIKKINDMIKQDSRLSQQIYEIETKLQ